MKTLTIAIPTRNRPKKILNLLNQLKDLINNPKIEVIIIDNSDNFATKEVLKEDFNQTNIKYFKNPDNQGLQYSIYKLIKRSCSIYTWFLSDDEKLIKNNFYKLLEILSFQDEIDMVVFDEHKNNLVENEYYFDNYFYDSTGVSQTLVKTEILKRLIKNLKYVNYLYPHTLLSLVAASDKDVIIRSVGFKMLNDTNDRKNYLFPTHFILSFNLFYLTVQASKAGVSKEYLKKMREYGKQKFYSKILEYIALNIKTKYRFNLFNILRPYLELRTVKMITIASMTQLMINALNLFPRNFNKKILLKIVNYNNDSRYKDIIENSTHMSFSSDKPIDTYTKNT